MTLTRIKVRQCTQRHNIVTAHVFRDLILMQRVIYTPCVKSFLDAIANMNRHTQRVGNFLHRAEYAADIHDAVVTALNQNVF